MLVTFWKKLQRIDWFIALILALLMVASFFVIRSATNNSEFIGFHVRQMTFYGLGFFVMLTVSFVNHRFIIKLAPYVYVLGVASLVAVYNFGAIINNSRGWFVIPNFGTLQPAELMKLCLIMMLAFFLARKEGGPLGLLRDIIPSGLILLLPFALVLVQPDLGNAIIYVVILLGMLWIANVRYIHVFLGTALAAGVLAGTLYLLDTYHDPIAQFLTEHGSGHWMARIDTFLYPETASTDDTYQIDNSRRAIGSGGLFGEGYMMGSSVQTSRIPYTYSDSIFVVVGEEFGFLGASVLLLLYFLLIYRLILIAIQSGHKGGSYMIIGIVSMFVFQIFQNIGMFLGILPLTGITLPFISYGGSSLLINMLSIGLAISIRVHSDPPQEQPA